MEKVAGLPRGEASARATKGRSCSAGRHPAYFRGHSVKPSDPYPLGKNQSLSSPPLMPRGHLLSAMRQKVSKDRSQGGSAPLANPRRNGPNLAEKNPVFMCRSAPRAAQGSGGSCTPQECSCSTERPITNHRQRKIRPRARPPAPAYGVRCAPRTATLRVATNSTQQSQTARLGRVLPMAGRTPPLGRPAILAALDAKPPGRPTRENELWSRAWGNHSR